MVQKDVSEVKSHKHVYLKLFSYFAVEIYSLIIQSTAATVRSTVRQ